MNALITQVRQNPAARSLFRKALTVGAAYASAKLGLSAEELAGVVGAVAVALQVQSSADDKKIAERTKTAVVAEISETIKLPPEVMASAKLAQPSGPPGYTNPADLADASRTGPRTIGGGGGGTNIV